jgi:hypothetical protein
MVLKEAIARKQPVQANEANMRMSYQMGMRGRSAKCKKSVMMYGALGKKINHKNPGKINTHQRPERDEYRAAAQMLNKYGIQAKNKFQIKFL